MQITELKVTIGEVCEGYINDAEEGVVGYDERLDIRPKYQREFVYKDKQRDEVIRTVMKGLPLNVIYWCKVKKEDGSDGFEVLDGQQRTISVCEYVDGTFSVDDKYFYNLPSDKQKQILDYPLFVYVCDGTDSDCPLEYHWRISYPVGTLFPGNLVETQTLIKRNSVRG